MTEVLATESALCRACGLCCQGQLYGWVSLRVDEVERVKTWPVTLVQHGDVAGFSQPCGCFREQQCSVYSQRPKTCVEYRCQLLRRLRQSETTQPVALELVRLARGFFDQIQARLPADQGKRIWQRIIERWDLTTLKSLLVRGDIDSATLMAIVSLDVLLTKHFRLVKEAAAPVVSADQPTS